MLNELLNRLEGYNKISGHREPGGGIVLMLHHSNTLDDALLVYVKDDSCVVDLDSETAERTNVGGAWNA